MGVYSLSLSTLHSSHNKSFIFSYSLNKLQMSILELLETTCPPVRPTNIKQCLAFLLNKSFH